MSQVRSPLYASRLVGAGIWMLASSGVLLLFMLATTVGPFRFGMSSRSAPRAIQLWQPPSPDRAATLLRVSAWRRVVPEERRVAGASSSSLPADPEHGLVVVPDARALGEAGLEALLDFARRGGGVVLAGPVAVRDAQGGWRGHAAMARLLGVPRVETLPPGASPALAAGTRGPLCALLDPGESIAVLPEAGLPGLPIAAAELVWQAPGRADPTEQEPPLAAARRWSLGAGRLVWLAAGPESAAGSLDPEGSMARLARAALTWAAGDPLLEVVPLDAAEPGSDAAMQEHWAFLRRALDTRVEWAGPHRLLVNLTNRSPGPLRARLRVHGLPPAREASVGATVLFQTLPEARVGADSGALELRLPELAAGTSSAFTVDFETPGFAQAEEPRRR